MKKSARLLQPSNTCANRPCRAQKPGGRTFESRPRYSQNPRVAATLGLLVREGAVRPRIRASVSSRLVNQIDVARAILNDENFVASCSKCRPTHAHRVHPGDDRLNELEFF